MRLVNELAERFDLTVLARRIPRGLPINHPPAEAVSVELGPQSRARFGWLVWRRLSFGRRFDFVLVQGYAIAALATNLATQLRRLRTFALVCSPVELYYRCRSQDGTVVQGKQFRRLEYVGLIALAWLNARLTKHYIVLSQHLAEVVRSHGCRSPIDVIPVYGVDVIAFRPAAETSRTIRQRLALPTDGAIIFFSSRVAPEKDSGALLRAFRTLLAEGRHLWLLHRSGGYQQFLDEAKRHGVEERVVATDARHPHKGLALDYQASDLCVQASREEGLGFSALEALACGIPVVATAVGGLRETIMDGETGWTYPVGDASALARCISAALDNPKEARRRAAAGRQLVLARYDHRRVFDRLEAVFREGL